MTLPDVHKETEDSRRKMIDLDIVATTLVKLRDQNLDICRFNINIFTELAKYGRFSGPSQT